MPTPSTRTAFGHTFLLLVSIHFCRSNIMQGGLTSLEEGQSSQENDLTRPLENALNYSDRNDSRMSDLRQLNVTSTISIVFNTVDTNHSHTWYPGSAGLINWMICILEKFRLTLYRVAVYLKILFGSLPVYAIGLALSGCLVLLCIFCCSCWCLRRPNRRASKIYELENEPKICNESPN